MAQHSLHRGSALKILLSCSALIVLCGPSVQAQPPQQRFPVDPPTRYGQYPVRGKQDYGTRPNARARIAPTAPTAYGYPVSGNQNYGTLPNARAYIAPTAPTAYGYPVSVDDQYGTRQPTRSRNISPIAHAAVAPALAIPALAAEILHYGKTCGSTKEAGSPGCQALTYHLGSTIMDASDFSAIAIDAYVSQQMAPQQPHEMQGGIKVVYSPEFYNEAIYRSLSAHFSSWGQETSLQSLASDQSKAILTRFLDLYCDLFAAAWNQTIHHSMSRQTFAELTRDIVNIGMMLEEITKAPLKLTQETDEVYKQAQRIVTEHSRGASVILARRYRNSSNPNAFIKKMKELADMGDLLAKLELAKYLLENKNSLGAGEYYAEAMNAISSHNNLDASSQADPSTLQHQHFATASHNFQQARLDDLQNFLAAEQQKAKPGQPEFFWHYLILQENLQHFKSYWEQLVTQYYARFVEQLKEVEAYCRNSQIPFEKRRNQSQDFYTKNESAIQEILVDADVKPELKAAVQSFMSFAKTYIVSGHDPTTRAGMFGANAMSLGGSAALVDQRTGEYWGSGWVQSVPLVGGFAHTFTQNRLGIAQPPATAKTQVPTGPQGGPKTTQQDDEDLFGSRRDDWAGFQGATPQW